MPPPATSRSRARRRLRLGAITLALGVASSVAVAWLFCVLPLPQDARTFKLVSLGRRSSEDPGGLRYEYASLSRWAGWRWYSTSADAPPGLMSLEAPVNASLEVLIPRPLRPILLPQPAFRDNRDVIACGWPMSALFCGTAFDWGHAPVHGRAEDVAQVIAGTRLPSGLAPYFKPTTLLGVALLPTRPLWGGLLLDVLFFSVAWLTLLTAPRALRQHLRRRRGHCPACGYDRSGDFTHPCPECGHVPLAGSGP